MEMRRPFLVLGIAVIIALFTSVLIYNWLQEKASTKAAAFETQPVVIAAIDIPWGIKITKEMVRKVDFPKGFLSAGCFSDPSLLEGRVLVYPVKANEPIFESRLAPMNVKGGGVAAVVDSRKRAVAIRVDRTTVASGSIQPGSRIDVLVTLSRGNKFSPVTKTILENIRVLAVGRETEEKSGKGEKQASADVITLEVTPEEAEKLGLAINEGKLLLALRNFGDTEDVLTKGIHINTLLTSYSSGPVRASERVGGKDEKGREDKSGSQKSPTFTVQLIKGKDVTEVKFDENNEQNGKEPK
jgi:pilus assembly protein CpaB